MIKASDNEMTEVTCSMHCHMLLMTFVQCISMSYFYSAIINSYLFSYGEFIVEKYFSCCQAPSYHVIFEVVLVMWIIRLLFFTKSYKPERTVLTEQVM